MTPNPYGARRGQVWQFTVGSQTCRGVVISNDDYNASPTGGVWMLIIQPASTNQHPDLGVPLSDADPVSPPGGWVDVPKLLRVDPTALRHCPGYLGHDTYEQVEQTLRNFLELP